MPHACLTASCVAVRTHLLRLQLGLLLVPDAAIGSAFRQVLGLKSQKSFKVRVGRSSVNMEH